MNNLEPPPTSRLPPIKALRASTAESLDSALSYLRLRYSPEVRGTKRTSRKVVFSSYAVAKCVDSNQEGNEADLRSFHLSILEVSLSPLT